MSATKVLSIFGLVLAGAMLIGPNVSYARDDHRRDRGDHKRNYTHRDYHRSHYSYRDHPRYGVNLSIIPSQSISISLGGLRFYYSDGIYYERHSRGYRVVHPPRGAIVRRIPIDYRPVIVNGITYYTDSGVYYVYTSNGYQVVPPPFTYAQPSVLVSTPTVINQTASVAPSPVVLGNDDTYTVNIPNEKAGGYTEVTLKRTDKGFLGPQGEFYSEFPRVAQLKTMYVK